MTNISIRKFSSIAVRLRNNFQYRVTAAYIEI